MITEEKQKCFVDEWIEVNVNTTKRYYESLGYKKYRNKENKLKFKVHPWELYPKSNIKIKIKCFECDKIRLLRYCDFYEAKTFLCKSCSSKKTKKDLIGLKFGRLTVIKDTCNRTKQQGVIWLCKCDCGNVCEVRSSHLLTGNTKSCGCLNTEKRSETLINYHRKKDHFIKSEHTQEEIENYIKNTKRNADSKWKSLSKKLRKNTKCIVCESKEDLVVHHLNEYWDYPEQRYDEGNLIVMCRSCHTKYHHFSLDITKENFELWILHEG